MRIYRDIDEIRDLGGAPRAVAIGTFDGFHRGHQTIVGKAVAAGRAMDGTVTVLTFDPHPSAVLDPDRQPPRLTTFEQKAGLLEQAGIDELVALPFDEEFSRLTPAEFAGRVLSERMNARQVHVGENFRFGHRGAGSAEDLIAFGRDRGFSVTATALVIINGRPVSSTRIRGAIAEGRVEEAQALLGRPHMLDGTVQSGSGRGRDLGSPTANLAVDHLVAVPGAGVYVTRTTVAPGEVHLSLTSIGTNPTFESDGAVRIETYVLDYSGDLYGRAIRVEFLSWIRSQRVFPDPDSLRRRIEADVTVARGYGS